MIKKNVYVSLILVLIGVLIITGCSGNSATSNSNSATSDSDSTASNSNPASEIISFKIAGNLSSLRLEAVKLFAKTIEEKSNGRLKPELFLEGQLGTNDEDLSTSISEGAFEMYFAQDFMANWVAPEWLGYANIPFAFRDPSHVIAFWNSDIGKEINERMISDYGVRLLLDSVSVRGARHITGNNPITNVDELKGLKFRVPNVPAFIESWNATGAIITPIPFGELFGAMQTGLVDAQENPLEQIQQVALFQVQKYLMMTGHQYGVYLTHVQEEWWQGLSEEDKLIIVEADKEAADYFHQELPKAEEVILKQFADAGMTIIEKDKIDIKSFQDKIVAAVLKANEGKWISGGWERIQDIK